MQTNNPNQNQQTQPKNQPKILIYVLLLLVFLSLGASGLLFYQNYQLKQQLSQIQTPSSITIPSLKPTQKPTFPTPTVTTISSPAPIAQPESIIPADWKTYENKLLKFAFNYPIDAKIEEKDNKAAGQFVISIKNSSLNFSLDIQKITERMTNNYLGIEPKETLTINSIPWDVLQSSGYCDAGGCGSPFFAFQTTKDDYRFIFLFWNINEKMEIQDQILSTFKFLD